jgi:carotenoid cleavage dioxygenase
MAAKNVQNVYRAPRHQEPTMMQTPFYLHDNYLPVHDELTAYDLPVTGVIPPELTGWYLRNGPNPRGASGHWFSGEGMIHGVRLEQGRAAWYRNRWVRTKSFIEGGELYRPDGSRDLTVSHANTHVISHAGRTLALVESSLPYEIDRDLRTLGPYDFGGRLVDSMTAHPKICPTTGELHFFGYGSLTAPYVNYHRADRSGVLTVNRPIDVPGHTMMHDFQLTANFVVFMDLPVVFDRSLATEGAMPFRWDDSYGARLGVLRRDDPYGAVRWFSIDPCYVFHALNASDDGDRIVSHVLRYPHLWRGTDESVATLWRWTIDLSTGSVIEEQCDDRPGEFPRIDDRLAGLDARFGHITAAADRDNGRPSAIVRYDLHSAATQAHPFAPGRTPGEAVFVPASDQPGGDGWLLTYVYDAAGNSSDLSILDTADLAGKPVATVQLPARVPYGFHGNWIPEG